MDFKQKIASLIAFKKQAEDQKDKQNIYDSLGVLEPFSALAGGQLNSFIAKLTKSEVLNENEQHGFAQLWNVSCVDIDGFGNNIWNLKNGAFTVYDKEGIKIQFEKQFKDIDDIQMKIERILCIIHLMGTLL